MQFFGKMAKNWLRNDIEILSSAFLDIGLSYKCAKFRADCFENGGDSIYKDRPKTRQAESI